MSRINDFWELIKPKYEEYFTIRGLLVLIVALVIGIPDWKSRIEFWRTALHWKQVSTFLLSGWGRVAVLCLGALLIWLDHRSVVKRHHRKTAVAAAPPEDIWSTPAPLPDRLIGVAKELDQLLVDVGPYRDVTFQSGMSGAEYEEKNKDVAIRERKIEAAFERRFRQRVADVYNEACETGTIQDAELESVLRTYKMDNDEAIRAVSKGLRNVAADLFKQQ